jgi:uncharacterized repeat protein (TIGR03803 family)
MKTSGLCVSALFAGCVVIAACSQPTELSRLQYTPNVNSLRNRGAGPLSYRVLHSFGADRDGDYANSDLLYRGDAFYGTTYGGGTHHCSDDYGGCGTVFSVTTSGSETVLYSFRGTKTSGRRPYAGLIDVNGTFYGTTGYGGPFDQGTFFSMTKDGSEKVLYSFGKGLDGYYPLSVLVDVDDTLYGTTSAGGTNSCLSSEGCGTVFRITTSGKEKVLYSFGEGADGRFPDAGLIDVHGILYGTTYKGGTYGAGSVFSITTDGREKVLHSFGEGTDGRNPASELIDVKGTLYGTTPYGGTRDTGTVFSITMSGKESVLHNFGKGTDASGPYGSLIDVGGTLYGTTVHGGGYGLGTLFSITTGGTEKVLHDFHKGTDGNGPVGDLAYERGSFFGITQAGGAYGSGVVFSLTP